MNASSHFDLPQLERQLYESTWNDGLLDLCTGAALMITGVFWVIGMSTYSTFAAPIAIPIWVAARRNISQPRMGTVTFGTDRVKRERIHFLALFLLGMIALIAGLVLYFKGVPNDLSVSLRRLNVIAGLPALLLAIPAGTVAVALGLPRFYLYGAVLLVSAIFVIYLDIHPGWAFIPCAAICLILGARLLVMFVRTHSKAD